MLKRYDGDASFSKRAKWVAADGGKCGEWFKISCSFVYDKSAGNCAVLLFCAADGAEIYINGRLSHRFVIRSYVFDAAYEALDMSKSLRDGKNELSVLFRDTGETDRCGVVFEIILGKLRLPSGSAALPLEIRRYERLSPGVSYMIRNGSGVEGYDAGKSEYGKKYGVRIAGNLLHTPVEAMHRSRLLPQTEKKVFPKELVLRERWAEGKGSAVRLSADGYTDTVHFAAVTARSDTLLTLFDFNNASASFDGKELKPGVTAALKKGEHLIAVAGRSPSLYIRTEAEISQWRYARYSEKKEPKRHYPWNDPIVPFSLCEQAKSAMRLKNIDKIQLYNSGVSPVQFEYMPHTRRMLSAADGLTPGGFGIPRETIAGVGITGDGRRADISPSEFGASFTFDFGREQVGYFAFRTDAPEGTLFEIHLYEASGGLGERFIGERNCIVYRAKRGVQSYISHCRRGFRFAKIFSSETGEKFFFSPFVISSHYPENGNAFFSCSDAELDRVYRMSRDTAELCMLDRYVDCPGYEQNVWTGDARITALINLCGFGHYGFNEEYLDLIGQSVSDGLTKYYRTNNKRYVDRLALPCAAFPTYPDGNIPVWSLQWILSVCDHYTCTGDKKAIGRCLPAIEETFRRIERQLSPRGLFAPEGTWNLIEWANNDLSEYGEVTANNMMLSACYTAVSHLEKALGRREIANEYEIKGKELKDRINLFCYDEKAGKYVDTVRDREAYGYYLSYCEHTKSMPEDRRRSPVSFEEFGAMSRFSVQTATFAVLYGIAEGERLKPAEKLLTDCVESGIYVPGTPANRTARAPSEKEAPGGVVRTGSPFFTFFVLDALYKIGRYDLAERVMKRDWGKFSDMGFTTCPEIFPVKDKPTRSVAHGWSASPAYFMTREILGVKPLTPGFKKFTVDPRTASVKEASGTAATPFGNVYVKWKATGDGYSIECKAPKGAEYIPIRRISFG